MEDRVIAVVDGLKGFPEAIPAGFPPTQVQTYPAIAPLWRRQWPQVIPVLASPQEVRQVIYTTNALESLPMWLRKIIKTRGHFPNGEAAARLLYLALRNITMPPRTWKAAMSQVAILFEERVLGG
jgi:putative transposase